MRKIALLLMGATVASCTAYGPPPGEPTPRSTQELAQLLAGKVPGKPISCLPPYNSNDQRNIDGRTVAFRVGTRQTYVMHLTSGCELLATGNYALVTRSVGGMGMCQNDIVRVVDVMNRTTVGSCGIESIVPFTAAGRPY
jgi:hypothetical protein